MRKTFQYLILLAAGVLSACNGNENQFDATGNFEADDVIVSAEASGKIVNLTVEEGQELKAAQVVGYIDTVQLQLKKKQLQYSIRAALARQPDAAKQLASLEKQIETAKREKERFEKLLKEEAATQKQVDDLTSQLEVLQKQYDGLQSSLSTTTQSIRGETLPLQAQIDQINDQIKKSIITNPIDGTVLVKYAEENEVAGMGKAIYKIADVSEIILRAYISGTQLPQLKLGQKAEVLIDSEGGYKSYEGTITWISDKAEFTPKTIQTKDERANLVYAMKIKVKNDGLLKIGMYAEVNFR
jgi:HlyD family secretion protein